MSTPDQEFERHRELMFGISYRMLGTVADAEDTIQETWLRWRRVDQAGVKDPRGYLVRAVTHTSIDQLRRAKARRESYIGQWLPEPLVTSPDAADTTLRFESVSMALLVLLERLSPLERAVFVLHDVFGFNFAEVAPLLDRSESAVRQLGKRARDNVRGVPRFPVDREQSRRVTERFLAACVGGDLDGLLAVLAPDVTLWVDSNGRSEGGPLEPLRGAAAIAGYLHSLAGRFPRNLTARPVDINGEDGGLFLDGDDLYAAFALGFADGGISAIRVVREAGKLSRLRV